MKRPSSKSGFVLRFDAINMLWGKTIPWRSRLLLLPPILPLSFTQSLQTLVDVILFSMADVDIYVTTPFKWQSIPQHLVDFGERPRQDTTLLSALLYWDSCYVFKVDWGEELSWYLNWWQWMVIIGLLMILIAWLWCSMWIFSLVDSDGDGQCDFTTVTMMINMNWLAEWIIAMYYCCCENLIDVLVTLSLWRSIDAAATTTEVCGLSQVTIVNALFDYDCCFTYPWLSNCTIEYRLLIMQNITYLHSMTHNLISPMILCLKQVWLLKIHTRSIKIYCWFWILILDTIYCFLNLDKNIHTIIEIFCQRDVPRKTYLLIMVFLLTTMQVLTVFMLKLWLLYVWDWDPSSLFNLEVIVVNAITKSSLVVVDVYTAPIIVLNYYNIG